MTLSSNRTAEEPSLDRGASTLTACTIISKNYLAYARVLTNSFLEAHPEGRVFVLIVDRLEAGFRRENEPFTLVEIDELDNIPNLPAFLFQYNQLECNTAAKPFFLDYLMRQAELDRVVYLDPDIQVFRAFDELYALLERHSIVLTPHMTSPVNDGKNPSETDILLAGTFNLGFIAVRDSEVTRQFIAWWKDRLFDRCISDQPKGLFVDQRWIDLVPGYFKDVHILTEPGYNVAYWNLHERRVTRSAEYLVNGRPLYFFHFSGLQLDSIERVSRYQNRFELGDLGDAAQLFHSYRDLLHSCGHGESKSLPYAFARYENGAPISSRARRMYRDYGRERVCFGNPFEVRSAQCYARRYRRLKLLQRLGLARRRSHGALASTSRAGGEKEALNASPALPTRVPSFRTKPGINLVGYLTAQSGMGEVARSLALVLESAGIPFSTHCLDLNVWGSRAKDPSSDARSDFRYDVNLLCVNADQVAPVIAHLGRGALCGRRNIGYWLWELAEFPERFHRAFDPFDEIWTASFHCVEALSAASSVPVKRVPLPIVVPEFVERNRANFGIPQDEFVFLFAFDFLSLWQRKNPVAVVRAFREAFSTEPVRLVLKCSNADFDENGLQQIKREVGDARVILIDRTLSRQGIHELFRACDAYVSLHRAEGFGLTIGEAMAMGLPVIATEYSGVVDFFSAENGWPVRYELRTLKRNVGPYPAGSRWAEPDVSHAAEQMRRVYHDSKERELRVQRAMKRIRENLSVESVGRTIAEYWSRLQEGSRAQNASERACT